MIRVVIDTNILVRMVLNPEGSLSPLLSDLHDGRILYLYSLSTLAELDDVLSRPRMRLRYGVTKADIASIIELLILRGQEVETQTAIHACRDPKDDQFLQVAMDGKADYLITSDQDLLVLDPFEGIPIVTPRVFSEQKP